MYYETAGEGTPVVLIHEAIGDSRLWDPQWTSFGRRYRVLRFDLPGFGRTPIETLPLTFTRDVASLMDELSMSSAGVVGCSMGGRIAAEIAVARPDLVGALVLGAPGLPGFEWSEDVASYQAAEEDAVTRGDLDAATEVNLRMWVEGPRRKPNDVDPSVRAAIAEMQRRSFELMVPHLEELDEDLLVPDLADRLSEVRAPTLVLVGDQDVDDMHRIAELYSTKIAGARLETIPGVGHALNFEHPEKFDARVLPFLADAL